jgi:Mn-dependent DtxR family transcriptional regulator
VDQQFSRWLLMSFDRLQSDMMTITQEQISHLLGVRRDTVTQTSSRLQKEGLIAKTRGDFGER